MKSFLFLLPLLGAFVLADDKCECPQVKCPANDAVALCKCLNSRETICKRHCPDYVPTYLPCPERPPTPTASAKPPKCTCETKYCPMAWPESCKCANNNAKECYDECGGDAPVYQVCDAAPTLVTRTVPAPKPSATHAVCGGGRGNYHTCADGFACIKKPGSTGCGPECDGYGICVKDKLCGGFAGFACDSGMSCIDDPRDDCDPKYGGADCGGLCMYNTYL
ncbi:hypothetical protein EJ04DRAFT_587022 [Polyplosphaeria fusca]|uniref:Uncharacterized protein n=1 Tax=Polyplosphaeria fusca TaxID=682080 RepID=A0A9P4R7K0_9PLEO|nr:hypothetical protein EJ04DRAFT_587022 [Polyplosphaeria fusca]